MVCFPVVQILPKESYVILFGECLYTRRFLGARGGGTLGSALRIYSGGLRRRYWISRNKPRFAHVGQTS